MVDRWLPRILLGTMVAYLIFGDMISPRSQNHEGDQCGPTHYWTYVRANAGEPELSCEPKNNR